MGLSRNGTHPPEPAPTPPPDQEMRAALLEVGWRYREARKAVEALGAALERLAGSGYTYGHLQN